MLSSGGWFRKWKRGSIFVKSTKFSFTWFYPESGITVRCNKIFRFSDLNFRFKVRNQPDLRPCVSIQDLKKFAIKKVIYLVAVVVVDHILVELVDHNRVELVDHNRVEGVDHNRVDLEAPLLQVVVAENMLEVVDYVCLCKLLIIIRVNQLLCYNL